MSDLAYDPWSPEFVADPYPVFERIRAERPVFFHEATDQWVISRYEDVDALLRDRRLGRTYLTGVGVLAWTTTPWTLPTNGGEAFVLLTAVVLGTQLPVVPVQLLWVNMVTAVALGLAVALPLTVSAQQTPPEPGPAKNITLPTPRTFTLDNGLEVKLLQYGTVPKVAVQLVMRVGNVDEAADEVWLADLVADMMIEGTTSRSGEQIATEAASMGGTLNIGVGSDETTIGGDALGEFAPGMIALVADVARNPAFPAGEMERLKTDMLRNLAITLSRPQSLAQQEFMAALYGDHPYGRVFPTEAMVSSYTLDQVRAFHDEHFDAARGRLYVVGQFDDAAVEAAVREAFAGWPAGSESAPPRATACRSATTR